MNLRTGDEIKLSAEIMAFSEDKQTVFVKFGLIAIPVSAIPKMEPIKQDVAEILYCSFCGCSQNQVKNLIAGPSVYICNECVEVCSEIITNENKKEESAKAELKPKRGRRKKIKVDL